MSTTPNPISTDKNVEWRFDIGRASSFLSALANPKRLEVMERLVAEEWNVGELSRAVGLSQSALSQHLLRLRQARLVETRRDGNQIFYSSTSAAVQRVLDTLDDIANASKDSPRKAVSDKNG